MTAELLDFTASPDAENYQREQRTLTDAILDSWRACSRQAEPEWRNSDRLYNAITKYTAFMERRTRALEQSCRALLTSEVLTEAQRTDLLVKFFGRTAAQRDMHVLTEGERDLILQYRTLDVEARRFVRTAVKGMRTRDRDDGQAGDAIDAEPGGAA